MVYVEDVFTQMRGITSYYGQAPPRCKMLYSLWCSTDDKINVRAVNQGTRSYVSKTAKSENLDLSDR